MKTIKRKALRVPNHSTKVKPGDKISYYDEEQTLLNEVVEIVVKIIKKDVDL